MNFEYLDEITFGDNNFKKELISIFTNQMPLFLSNMKKFLSEKDLKNLAKEAHTAKSSVLIFGREDSGQILKEIQSLAEQNNLEPIPDQILKVETDMDNVLKELTEMAKIL